MDHKDGDAANNRWNNLREATRGQNNQNRKSRGRWKHTDLGLEMGVEVTPIGRFRVKVQGIHLGTFDTVEEANERARFGRKHLYGEFDIYSSRGKENANIDK
jgi:hypothetical protein